MSKLFLDASAWVEYFLGTSRGLKVREEVCASEVYTNGIVIAELCGKFLKERGSPDAVVEAVQQMAVFVPVDANMGRDAAILLQIQRQKKQKFGLADAFVIASAQSVGAQVITCDNDFRGLPNVTIIQ